ncbi:MAG: preprotein translocase subunit SecA [Duodenibacillus sp.]|nr:preprotein translocase subunit SecA [Sutterella sp.]MDY3273923.1 preprotein translocase subunit SecA [Duodenibacillus sp.]
MFDSFLTKIFGSRNERLIKQYRRKVALINKLEPAIQKLTDAELAQKTEEFRARYAKGETLEKLLPEAFAVAREASFRVLGQRPYDVQLIGAMVLNDNKIAEMRTGEGKTLTAVMAVYLNAIAGKGVHVVTVNDYLASRDAAWMGHVYNFLGLSVGTILSSVQDTESKRKAYAADVTYGTNNEFGFDYLRDNMEYEVSHRRQRGLFYAIVDEVDSILIDEARTPLIISGSAEDSTELYRQVNDIPALLIRQKEEKGPGDYWVDEKQHQVYLSDAGHEHVEKILIERGMIKDNTSLYSAQNIMIMSHLIASLRAHTLFHRDQHYVVQNGEIVIVDEFTGRLMPGRRWSDGLHQAIEAKEGVEIKQENQTLASITFQNYFRMYKKLAGMTGTADTEAYEFQDIYGLETVVIPTHRKMIRVDEQDKVFRTEEEKYRAIIRDIQACHARHQPVLVGTTSIENSERLSKMLDKLGIDHNVLNAKQHEREAQVILEAGRPGVVTIATNMAGRGTDIVLGGGINKRLDEINFDNELSDEEKKKRSDAVKADWLKLHDEVVAAGGLRIIGSERHESRRIDNQLRGRSGRQGDPGSSVFYLSMEDQLLRIFGGDRMRAIADRLKLEKDVAIESKMLSRMIESAQRKVEGHNYDIRKQLLEFDDVQNDQRQEIYRLRNEILENNDVAEGMKELRHGYFTKLFRSYVPAETVEEQWDLAGLTKVLKEQWGLDIPMQAMLEESNETTDEDLLNKLLAESDRVLREKEEIVGHESWTNFSKSVLLQMIDSMWRQHLQALDALRMGVFLRSYAAKQPKQEYKREAFSMFETLLDNIAESVSRILMRVQIQLQDDSAETIAKQKREAEAAGIDFSNVGRNDPCPCGSGKKYKDCHGRLA